ncbi:hypothetical protein COO60DRAFT_568151 [Scenedesmus sp. NREL 46B-D3]|nr:hypothetical protein COO60DRAFT_568151 [Scenedesmus sp. NREL 46B-D3]
MQRLAACEHSRGEELAGLPPARCWLGSACCVARHAVIMALVTSTIFYHRCSSCVCSAVFQRKYCSCSQLQTLLVSWARWHLVPCCSWPEQYHQVSCERMIWIERGRSWHSRSGQFSRCCGGRYLALCCVCCIVLCHGCASVTDVLCLVTEVLLHSGQPFKGAQTPLRSCHTPCSRGVDDGS